MKKVDLDNDYQDFISSESIKTPSHLDEAVLSCVHLDLNPSHKVVYFKLLAIQAFIGLLTMLFCPQFNLSFTNNYELFHYFHHNFGAFICSAICGGIFVGSGAIFASYTLKLSELRRIQSNKLLYYFSLSGVFALSFLLFNTNIYIEILLVWFLGASVIGILVAQINYSIRLKLV